MLRQSLLGSATNADLCLLSRLYRTGLLVYLWNICKWIELSLLTSELNCWFPDNADRICSEEPFVNRSTTHIFFSTTSGGCWARREVKAFKTLIKNKV